MKKTLFLTFAALLLLFACGCSENTAVSQTAGDAKPDSGSQTVTYASTADPLPNTDLSSREADVDLTNLDTQMAYVQLSNMMLSPEDYVGKTVKLRGKFAHAEEESKEFFVCYLMDATACCSQSLEFETDGVYDFPEGYPAEQSEITVCGVFDTYEYNGYAMYRLLHAEVEYKA